MKDFKTQEPKIKNLRSSQKSQVLILKMSVHHVIIMFNFNCPVPNYDNDGLGLNNY